MDVLAQAGHARHEAAVGAHDAVDADARLRCLVELLDHLWMSQAVALDPDAGVGAVGGGVRHVLDSLDQLLPEIERGHEQPAEALWPAEARDEVEEVGHVLADLGVGGEDADVLVRPCRRRVVVAGADVHVPAQLIALAPNDERRLGVNLHVGEAVDDVHPRLFQGARPVDVAALVEARLQLDHTHDLLAVLRRLDERRRDRRVVARAVDRRLQRDDLRIRGRSLQECFDARPEGVVRVVDDDVPARDLLEEIVARDGEAPLRVGRPRRVLEIGTIE